MREHEKSAGHGSHAKREHHAQTPGRESRAQGLAAGAAHAQSDTVFKATPWSNVTEADIP